VGETYTVRISERLEEQLLDAVVRGTIDRIDALVRAATASRLSYPTHT